MRAKDALGALRRAGRGRAPGRRRDDGPRAQLALRHRRDRHRGARRRRAGRLRGQDPVGRRRLGHPLEAVTRAQGRAAAPARGALDRRAAACTRRTCAIDVVGVLRPAARRGRGRARAGGGLSAAGPDPGGGAGRASTGTWSRSRPTSATGVPSFSLVGLPDASLTEARDRVRAAMVNSGQHWPPRSGSTVEPLAGQPAQARARASTSRSPRRPRGRRAWCRRDAVADAVLLGELGLDGRVRPVRGVLPAVLAAAAGGRRRGGGPGGQRGRGGAGARRAGHRGAHPGRAGRAGPRGDGRPTSSWPRTPARRSTRPTDDPAHRPDLADVLGQADRARRCSRSPRPAATTC